MKRVLYFLLSICLSTSSAFAKDVVFQHWKSIDGTIALLPTQLKNEDLFRQFVVRNVGNHNVFYISFFEKNWSGVNNTCDSSEETVVIRVNNTPINFNKSCLKTSYLYSPVSQEAIEFMDFAIKNSQIIDIQIDQKVVKLGTKKLKPLLKVIYENNTKAL